MRFISGRATTLLGVAFVACACGSETFVDADASSDVAAVIESGASDAAPSDATTDADAASEKPDPCRGTLFCADFDKVTNVGAEWQVMQASDGKANEHFALDASMSVTAPNCARITVPASSEDVAFYFSKTVAATLGPIELSFGARIDAYPSVALGLARLAFGANVVFIEVSPQGTLVFKEGGTFATTSGPLWPKGRFVTVRMSIDTAKRTALVTLDGQTAIQTSFALSAAALTRLDLGAFYAQTSTPIPMYFDAVRLWQR